MMGLFDDKRWQPPPPGPSNADLDEVASLGEFSAKLSASTISLVDLSIRVPKPVVDLLSVYIDAAHQFKPIDVFVAKDGIIDVYLRPGSPLQFSVQKNVFFGLSPDARFIAELWAVPPANSRIGPSFNAAEAKRLIEPNLAELRLRDDTIPPPNPSWIVSVLIELKVGQVLQCVVHADKDRIGIFEREGLLPDSWIKGVTGALLNESI